MSYLCSHMIYLSMDIILLHISHLLRTSVGVMSWFSTVEASIVIDCIWRLWCAILLWSIRDIALHRSIVSLLLALDWCLILLLLLLCTVWLLVAVDQTRLTLIALLWLSLLRIGTEARVAPKLLSLELSLLVLHLAALVLYNQGLVHQLLETGKGMR